MIKITHYEVYADKGNGWQLEGRYALEQRQEAFNQAKELEISKYKVKIIKEIFDVQDNSYQETVEYVSNLSKKGKGGKAAAYDYSGDDDEEEESIKTQEVVHEHAGVIGAVSKLIFLTLVCLGFANVLVSLIYPVIENFIPEENNKPILFLIFFVLFLSIAIPLILKKIPWYVFTPNKTITRKVPERKLYDKAEELYNLYNINEQIAPEMTPAYPEAPLEYKQYIISFLTDLLANIKSRNTLQTNFSKFGVKLIVYGGCLEMARYSGLNLGEANSVLYEAFQILDGEDADLEAFYDAKRSYQDNKVAIFLTGVGAYLMAHVINGRKMPTELLNITFDKWEKLNQSENDIAKPQPEPERQESEIITAEDIMLPTMVSIKSDLKFLEDLIPNKDEIAAKSSADIRNIIFNLIGKYKGENTIEADGITSIKFRKLNNALHFALECMKDISSYQDETNSETLILRNCCVIIPYHEDEDPNESSLLDDMFDHVYNGEIIVSAAIKDDMQDHDEYHFEDLGEKILEKSHINMELYKLTE